MFVPIPTTPQSSDNSPGPENIGTLLRRFDITYEHRHKVILETVVLLI